MELVAVAFVLSIDNVRLAGGLGLLDGSVRRWCCLALLMAVVESLFPLIGAAATPAWLAGLAFFDGLGPVAFMVAATLSLAGFVWKRLPRAHWMLYALPVLFGLDNLLAGAALGVSGMQGVLAALFVGVISGGVSLATMFAVGRGTALLAPRWAAAQAAVIVALGFSFFVLP